MAISWSEFDLGILGRFAPRALALRESARRLADRPEFRAGRRRALTAFYLLAALSLGCWAEDASRAASIASWLQGHPPSQTLWTQSLEPLGYRVPQASKDGLLLQRVARTLPSPLSAENAVWITPDAHWIVVFRDATPGFFCRDCAPPQLPWEGLGDGWSGFEPAMIRAKKSVVPARSAAKRAVSRDPLELVF